MFRYDIITKNISMLSMIAWNATKYQYTSYGHWGIVAVPGECVCPAKLQSQLLWGFNIFEHGFDTPLG